MEHWSVQLKSCSNFLIYNLIIKVQGKKLDPWLKQGSSLNQGFWTKDFKPRFFLRYKSKYLFCDLVKIKTPVSEMQHFTCLKPSEVVVLDWTVLWIFLFFITCLLSLDFVEAIKIRSFCYLQSHSFMSYKNILHYQN